MPAYGRRITPETRDLLAELVRAVPLDFGGGSSLAKALVFADLIAGFGVQDAIEIGVYRGRSLLPTAAVLRAQRGGRVIGIDPWSADAALQNDDHEVGGVVNDWARAHPWEQTYRDVLELIDRFGLGDHCEVLRLTSEAASARIADGSVGLVHVDGNHDRAAVQLDVDLYLPKLRPGGFLVLDDASWTSVRSVMETLRGRLEPVFQLYDALPLHDEQATDFAVFRVPAERYALVKVVIYGSRPDGHAKVLLELCDGRVDLDVVGLLDDHAENRDRAVRGVRVLGGIALLAELAREGVEGVLLGFGTSHGRAAIARRVLDAGLGLPVISHTAGTIAPSAVVRPGAQVLTRALVGPDAVVGEGALVNTGAILDRDVRLAPGAVVGPGAVLAGRVAVERDAMVGAGATILPDRSIGTGAVVGAGAVVTRDVPADAVVVGVPARSLVRRD